MAGKSDGSNSSLRGANGSRECAPDDSSATKQSTLVLSCGELDCFACARDDGAVIPGRVADASPESITTIGSMDSGPAPSGASRNDGRWNARHCEERQRRSNPHLSCGELDCFACARNDGG